ncbi:MAG: hypothetical protein ACLQUY_08720 [Ktedonobacterales bacterium]
MNERWSDRVGNVITLNKSVSEADIALFGLISRDDAYLAEDPAPPVRQPRQMAPYPWLASLLATAATRVISPPEQADFLRQHIEFSNPAYTEDTLHMTVEVIAYDEAHQILSARVMCHNQDHLHLAHAEFSLNVGSSQEPS